MKTCDLTGSALDWAVAMCEGATDLRPNHHRFCSWLLCNLSDGRVMFLDKLKFSSDWGLAGPIIEREDIATFPASYVVDKFWCATQDKGGSQPFELRDLGGEAAWWFTEDEVITGPTPLVAAMRCYVATKLGNEVDIPEVLL